MVRALPRCRREDLPSNESICIRELPAQGPGGGMLASCSGEAMSPDSRETFTEASPMNAIELLKEQHDEVEDMFEKIEKADGAKKEALFEKLNKSSVPSEKVLPSHQTTAHAHRVDAPIHMRHAHGIDVERDESPICRWRRRRSMNGINGIDERSPFGAGHILLIFPNPHNVLLRLIWNGR